MSVDLSSQFSWFLDNQNLQKSNQNDVPSSKNEGSPFPEKRSLFTKRCRTDTQPKTAQTSQRHPKGQHEKAKETPEDPKGCQKSAGGLPKISKNDKHKQLTKKHAKHTKLSLEPPSCGPVSHKNARESPKTAQTSQRHPKGRHENAKEIPKDPKEPEATQKTAKLE